jgi:hypothetical protein
MTKRTMWRVGFLGVTGLAIAAEIYSVVDGSDDTEPWTDLITKYIPGEVTGAAIGGLALWLAIHFGIRYWRKSQGDPAYQKDEPKNED